MNGPTSEDRVLAAVCHGCCLLSEVGIGLVVPLIIMLCTNSEFVHEQAKESLNFQLNIVVWAIIALMLFMTVIGAPIAMLMFVAIGLAGLFLPIVAAVKVIDGKDFRYPYTFRIVRN